jgi:glyoxylase-like metal-dependent hydrolase (beta-lactamase superfamily II)
LQEKVVGGPYHGMMLEEQKVMKQFDCNVKHVDISLNNGDTINVLGGLNVISVPGHTPGSIALYEEKRRIMFFGDVIRNSEKRGLTVGIPEKFNCDTHQTEADAALLLSYSIDYALLSHGEPVTENTNEILKRLLK